MRERTRIYRTQNSTSGMFACPRLQTFCPLTSMSFVHNAPTKCDSSERALLCVLALNGQGISPCSYVSYELLDTKRQ
ncbi:uncharacterized protein LAESUDRAFT_725099 [Laetiporus sulphureus 93-53]|uniref:Uncharacterized protein n=1 Tax=Laetiporus sulphureus 93-53 TaxID=1314785 RepID=A0A165EJS9_9APHY|nr:uncharacterized protein LAESUDRAFT_725099 [Laetiporus sulphureus 93-53]KZT07199.1 hypothetical protein LAESUDRAFT_725099 [Laetiporus sulphureus 93-53]